MRAIRFQDYLTHQAVLDAHGPQVAAEWLSWYERHGYKRQEHADALQALKIAKAAYDAARARYSAACAALAVTK